MLMKQELQDFVDEYQVRDDWKWDDHPTERIELTRMLIKEPGWLFDSILDGRDEEIERLINLRLASNLPNQAINETFGRMLIALILNTATDSLDDFMSDLNVLYCGEEPAEAMYGNPAYDLVAADRRRA